MITSVQAGTKPAEFRERKQLRSVASYLWCSELLVFLKREVSCSTQDLNQLYLLQLFFKKRQTSVQKMTA